MRVLVKLIRSFSSPLRSNIPATIINDMGDYGLCLHPVLADCWKKCDVSDINLAFADIYAKLEPQFDGKTRTLVDGTSDILKKVVTLQNVRYEDINHNSAFLGQLVLFRLLSSQFVQENDELEKLAKEGKAGDAQLVFERTFKLVDAMLKIQSGVRGEPNINTVIEETSIIYGFEVAALAIWFSKVMHRPVSSIAVEVNRVISKLPLVNLPDSYYKSMGECYQGLDISLKKLVWLLQGSYSFPVIYEENMNKEPFIDTGVYKKCRELQPHYSTLVTWRDVLAVNIGIHFVAEMNLQMMQSLYGDDAVRAAYLKDFVPTENKSNMAEFC